MRRMLQITAILVLSLVMITGCSQSQEENANSAVVPGANVRYSIPLPTPANPDVDKAVHSSLTVEILNLKKPGDTLLPMDPLVLQFSESMDISDDPDVISFAPAVEGTESWNDSQDQLTFTPKHEFSPGEGYSLSFAEELRSLKGQIFEIKRPINIRIEPPPHVSRRSPRESTVTDRFPQISLTFSKDMDKGSVESALSVQPVIGYDVVWEYPDVVTILVEDSLSPGNRYRFSLNSTAKDLLGISMADDYGWFIALEDLKVDISKRDDPNTSDPFTLSSNFSLTKESFEHSFNIEPDINGEFDWASDMHVVSFFPDPEFAPDTDYTVSFTKPLLDSYGYEVGTPQPLNFRSPPPILGVGPTGGEEGVQTDEIWVNFDRPMDQESTESAFQIEPPLLGYFTWDENKMTFHMESFLSVRTEYSVTIGEGAKDREGRKVINQPFTWSFMSDYYNQRSKFGEMGSKIQIVDSNGLRAVQFGLAETDPTRVFFDLYKLNMRQFVDLAVQDPSFNAPNFLEVNEFQDPTRSWEITSGLDGEHWNIKQVYIPGDVPPGLYIMAMRIDGRIHDQIAIVLTENTVVAKSAGRNLMVWVTDIHGDVVPNVEIRLYTTDGSQIRETLTDERGVYRTTLHPDHEPLLILARDKNEDVTVSGVNSTWQEENEFSWRWWRVRPVTVQSLNAYVYTDRPIYKPGQSVLFKAIIREDDDVRYTVLPTGTPVTVVVRDARGNQLRTFHLLTNGFGSVFGEFQLSEGAMLGEYAIDVLIGGERHGGGFKVEDYRKPDILIDVSTDENEYIQGEEITLDIDVQYLFGEPISDAKVIIRQYQLGQFYGYWWEDRPEEDEVEYTWYMSGRRPIEGKLDIDGHLSTTIQATLGNLDYVWDSWRDSLITSTWGIEVSVDDGSNQVVSAFTIFKVFNASEKLRVDADGYLFTIGGEIEVEASVMSVSNEPVPDHRMRLDIMRWERSSRSYVAVDDTIHTMSGAGGLARISFILEETGWHKLILTSEDKFGNEITSSDWIAVYESEDLWGSTNHSTDLAISVDRFEFSPYQTATLQIESSFEGPALITVERGKVLREMLIQLTPPVTSIDLSLHEVDVPNIFVTVSAWKTQLSSPGEYEYSNMPESLLLSDSVELTVDSEVKELQVEIIPEQEFYRPGDEATVRIIVADYQGRPVSAEVSLAVVDEAIFSLSEEMSLSMIDAFYGRRLNAVQTYNSMAPFRWIWTPGRGGGGGGWEGSPPNDLRSEFLDTAAWFPNLQTNSAGEVVVAFVLPDNLTTWKLTAKAITRNTKVGETTANVLTHKDLVVRPLLPRSLVSGDQVIISTLVHNFSDQARWISVSLETFSLEIESEKVQEIFLQPDETGVIGWDVLAGEFGEVKVTVSAFAGDLQDSVQLTFPVLPLAEIDIFSENGRVDDEFQMVFTIPEDAMKVSSLTVELSRSIDGNLLSGLEYLTGFPYGCVEQIMSKALPNAVVGRALNIVDERFVYLPYDLSDKISMGLQMLYAKQHQDGGWGWWYDDESHDYQTAWVVFGLAMTSEAGYEVDPQVIERGVNWLSEYLTEMDPRTQAFALYGMALAGEGNLEATLELAHRVSELDTFSLAALALALDKLGEGSEAQALLNLLEDTAEHSAAKVHWDLPYGDGYYKRKTMASSIRSTALALSAFMQIDPDNDLVSGIVRWLLEKREPRGWGTTNETSFAILGLTDYVVSVAQASEHSDYIVEINGEQIAEGKLSLDRPIVQVEIGIDQMVRGENLLRIVRSGDGALYYVVAGETYLAREEIEAQGEVSITRIYYDADTDRRIDQVEAGSLVKVELNVNMPVDGYYMIVEDYLPGGLEALNEGLNTSSRWIGEANYVETDYRWRSLGYNNKEVYGDRVSFFITDLSKGRHKFTYFARATSAGNFVALPTQAWGMYDLALCGRSASDQFTVEDDWFAMSGADDDLTASLPED